MITDRIENHTLYPFGPAWEAAFNFLNTVVPDMEDKKYILQGDSLFAIVESYPTKPRDAAKLETHQKYVDIQVIIRGRETFEIFPKQGLTVRDSYNPEKDIAFYQIPSEVGAKITMEPGRFLVFFPDDAHMPCLMTGSAPESVKKVVVKVAMELLASFR